MGGVVLRFPASPVFRGVGVVWCFVWFFSLGIRVFYLFCCFSVFGIKASGGGQRARKKVAAEAKAAAGEDATAAALEGKRAEEEFTSELTALAAVATDDANEVNFSELERSVSVHGCDVQEKALGDLLKGCGPGVPSPDGITYDPTLQMWLKNGKPMPNDDDDESSNSSDSKSEKPKVKGQRGT